MQVSLCNDVSPLVHLLRQQLSFSTTGSRQGPVTIAIDSKAKSPSAAPSKSNTPSASGTTTPSRSEMPKVQLTLAEKKAKRANAAKAFAEQRQLSSADQSARSRTSDRAEDVTAN